MRNWLFSVPEWSRGAVWLQIIILVILFAASIGVLIYAVNDMRKMEGEWEQKSAPDCNQVRDDGNEAA